jgi:hypothetical protein
MLTWAQLGLRLPQWDCVIGLRLVEDNMLMRLIDPVLHTMNNTDASMGFSTDTKASDPGVDFTEPTRHRETPYLLKGAYRYSTWMAELQVYRHHPARTAESVHAKLLQRWVPSLH